MRVPPVALLVAVRDRKGSTTAELALRIRRAEPDVQHTAETLTVAKLLTRNPGGTWALTRAGRQLLEVHERRREIPRRFDRMMRRNRSILI